MADSPLDSHPHLAPATTAALDRSRRDDVSGWEGWGWTLPVAVFLVLACALYPTAGVDDAYITYWASDVLVRTGEIVNYNAARVEQSSSLLHVLTLALANWITHVPIPVLSAIVGLACGTASVLLTWALAARIRSGLRLPSALLVAVSQPVLFWSWAGLETLLACAVGLLFVITLGDLLERTALTSRLALAGTALVTVASLLVRPESPVVLACAVGAVAAVATLRQWTFKSLEPGVGLKAISAVVGIIVVAALIAVSRTVYFGSPVPQPVLAKANGLSLTRGLAYFKAHVANRSQAPLWALAAYSAARALFRSASDTRFPARLTLVAAYAIAQCAFILLAGGDWMPAGRFLVPTIPVIGVLALLALPQDQPRIVASAATLLIGLQLWPSLDIVRFRARLPVTTLLESTQPVPAGFLRLEAANSERRDDMLLIDVLSRTVSNLRATRREPVWIMTGQMGMQTYYLSRRNPGQFHVVDRFALASTEFLQCSVSRQLPHDSLGLRLEFPFYFARRADYQKECAIPQPDIIVDLEKAFVAFDPDLESALAKNGYAVTFHSNGRVIAVRAGAEARGK